MAETEWRWNRLPGLDLLQVPVLCQLFAIAPRQRSTYFFITCRNSVSVGKHVPDPSEKVHTRFPTTTLARICGRTVVVQVLFHKDLITGLLYRLGIVSSS